MSCINPWPFSLYFWTRLSHSDHNPTRTNYYKKIIINNHNGLGSILYFSSITCAASSIETQQGRGAQTTGVGVLGPDVVDAVASRHTLPEGSWLTSQGRQRVSPRKGWGYGIPREFKGLGLWGPGLEECRQRRRRRKNEFTAGDLRAASQTEVLRFSVQRVGLCLLSCISHGLLRGYTTWRYSGLDRSLSCSPPALGPDPPLRAHHVQALLGKFGASGFLWSSSSNEQSTFIHTSKLS